MCQTNIYVDRYPDGREVEFQEFKTCQYGAPGRPCPTHSIQTNPIRKIQHGEPTTQYILTQPMFPATPPRSSGGSHHRLSNSHRRSSASPATSEEGHRRRKRLSGLKPTRTHRKERIIIVDAPPTPRTPPQIYPQTFTAPSSPNPPFTSPRRPIIVDERSMRRDRDHQRSTSIGAVVGDRRPSSSSSSRPHSLIHAWDTPSSSHTSFDLRAEREREEQAAAAILLHRQRRRQEAATRDAETDAEIRRARRIAEADARIRNRPAVPIPPRPLNQRPILRQQVVDQSQALQGLMGGLSLGGTTTTEQQRRRAEFMERDRAAFMERVEASEQVALRQRLRERQMPRRRFSVGPGGRRHRVLYDDGVYRWE